VRTHRRIETIAIPESPHPSDPMVHRRRIQISLAMGEYVTEFVEGLVRQKIYSNSMLMHVASNSLYSSEAILDAKNKVYNDLHRLIVLYFLTTLIIKAWISLSVSVHAVLSQ
jgi:hypothetical protein